MATSNSIFHPYGRNNYCSLNFISITSHFVHPPPPPPPTLTSSRHSIFTFTAAALLNFLELKYQGKNESPFKTHPGIMVFAVTALLLYSLAYNARSRYNWRVKDTCIFGVLMVFFGPLSLAAKISILLPSTLCPAVFSLAVMFSLSEYPFFSGITLGFLKWIRDSIQNVHDTDTVLPV